VVPDLVTIAKGLGGGYQPVGAVLAQRRIVEAMSGGSGFFQHGHTYLGHPVACAAALAVQRVIHRDGLLARVRAEGEVFGGLLREALGAQAYVGDIRGRGFFWGVELVADRAAKTPFDPALKLHARIKQEAMAPGPAVLPLRRHRRRPPRRPRAAGAPLRRAARRARTHCRAARVVDRRHHAFARRAGRALSFPFRPFFFNLPRGASPCPSRPSFACRS
jgi:hypothetical protein